MKVLSYHACFEDDGLRNDALIRPDILLVVDLADEPTMARWISQVLARGEEELGRVDAACTRSQGAASRGEAAQ